ncbi:MAG TPA: DUF2726 domain-containing protein [Rubrivivax sp.]|nr:DUF2726 domain-containing protein [Burkholderiales bacterium]HNU10560.1 DUF2726 domain-containing protein [Rubrivivax sp.]
MLALLPWLLASIAAILLVAATALWWVDRRRGRRLPPLPREWALTPRPVFNSDERRVYRQLREALPHHVVLSKLPLVRFCQPIDPEQTRYWYRLLGSINVTFAICSPNGRVLAAIDLEHDRAASRRVLQTKQAVLGACRIRYLRCPVDLLPSIPELQLLVPQSGQPRGPHAAPMSGHAPDAIRRSLGERRRGRHALWQDSGFFQDSFFGSDTGGSRDPATSDFAPLDPPESAEDEAPFPRARPPSGPPPIRH